MRAQIYLLAATLCLAPRALPAQQTEQPSVAEAARQARQAQKHAPKDVKLYTNDNLPRRSDRPSIAGAETRPSSSAQASPQQGKPAEGAKKQPVPEEKRPAYWRRRFAETRARLAQAVSELASLQREMGRLQVQDYDDPNKGLMQGYTRSDIRDQQAKIAAKQNEIDHLREQLRKLEDELRRSGGEPGWAR
jgi:chromosome segregation ATPase